MSEITAPKPVSRLPSPIKGLTLFSPIKIYSPEEPGLNQPDTAGVLFSFPHEEYELHTSKPDDADGSIGFFAPDKNDPDTVIVLHFLTEGRNWTVCSSQTLREWDPKAQLVKIA